MATKRDILLRLTGDPSDAQRAIKGVEGDVKELDRTKADVRVDIKTQGLDAKLNKLNVRLNRLGQQVQTPEIKIRTAGVLGQIEKVESELNRLHDKHVDITGGGGAGGAGAGGAAGLAARGAGAFAAAGGGAVAALAGKQAIETASDINEAVSKNRVLFGRFADDVERFAETSAKSFGISKAAALDATGVFGNLAVALGIAPERAAKLSVRLTKLAADLASFNNASPEDALEAIRAGLVGETEPLRKFGVNINENALKAEALSAGLVKAAVDTDKVKSAQISARLAQEAYTKAVKEHGKSSTEATKARGTLLRAESALNKAQSGSVPVLTAQQKALAATNLIFRQTSTAQGDFTRTSQGFANQTRILKAELSDLAGVIGAKVLPTVNALIRVLTSALHGDFSAAVRGLKDLVVAQLKLLLGAIKLYTLPYRKAGAALGHALANGLRAAFHSVLGFVTDRVNDLIGAFNALPGPDLSFVGVHEVNTKAGDALKHFGDAVKHKGHPAPSRHPSLSPPHAPSGRTFAAASVVQNFGDVILPASAALTGNTQYDALKLHRHLRRRGTSLPA